jgi:hypothetical protein
MLFPCATRFLLPTFEDNPLSLFQTVHGISQSLCNTVHVATRDLSVVCVTRRGRTAQVALEGMVLR